MATRHYSRELDPFAATLVDPNVLAGFTYATLARINQRPALLFDQAQSADPAAMWEILVPKERVAGYPIYVRLNLMPKWPTTPPVGWSYRMYVGVEVVKPNSSQTAGSGSYFPVSMLTPTQTATAGDGQVASFTYQIPDAQVATISQDDLLRVFVGLRRADTYAGLKLYMIGGVLYDELAAGP